MSESEELYNHTAPIEVRFVDLDSFGHVNNAHHLTYIEQARVSYFDKVIGYGYDWSKEGIILAKAQIDYIVPIHLNDRIYVRVRCSRIGSKSMELEYQIVRKERENEVSVAKATTVIVAYDFTASRSITVPENWKKAILDFEKSGTVLHGKKLIIESLEQRSLNRSDEEGLQPDR